MIGRYEVISELGVSSSGTVFQARDRLTGRVVALRRVTTTSVSDPEAVPEGQSERRRPSGARLRLAHQLQLVASLRHPNLVGVIDYGFDAGGRPFYTQRLIERPVELLQAAKGLTLEERLGLLIQVLEGLAYLHRHHAVHGDLRSRTALVEGGEVRLVNFGLPILRAAPKGGVRAAVAPEMASGGSASRSSDLYAVGVLALELLAEGSTARQQQLAAPSGAPVISTESYRGAAVPVLERLLASASEQRTDDANRVIGELCSAYGIPLPEESEAIRESYLQRARMVDRQAEMGELQAMLEATLEGRGGSLILHGESGVGRSRLLEELRTVSLAQGAEVLQEQTTAEGFSPYSAWRLILHHLCLLVEPSDDELAILAEQLPELGGMLDRATGAPPVADPHQRQRQFTRAVRELFQRLEKPAVVLLDDLHWAGSESLALVRALQPMIENRRLMLVGTYRDDERPDLAQELAELPSRKLERLDRSAVGDLAESVLGPKGRASPLIRMLQRESAGNVFFLLEILRALAYEAGRLEDIDPQRLPKHLTTGGILRVLKRRLDRLPRKIRPLLQLAAVAGRAVDLEILKTLEPGLQANLWLRFCSDQAVLEVSNGRWRFANDRYRAALLDDLSAAELRAAYRRVAEATARAGAGSPERVARLAHYWSRAADLSDPEATRQAVRYLERAGRAAFESCAAHEAERLLRRGLALLDLLPGAQDRHEQQLQLGLGGALLMLRGFAFAEVGQCFGRARALGERLGRDDNRMTAQLGLWRFHIVRSELETADELAAEMMVQASQRPRASSRIVAEYALGATAFFRGSPETAVRHTQRAVDLHHKLRSGSRREVAAAAFYLGQNPGVAALGLASWANWLLGYPEHARALSRRAIQLAEALEHPFSQAFALLQQTWLGHMRDDPEAVSASAQRVVEQSREQGFVNLMHTGLVFLGWARARRGEVEPGIVGIEAAIAELRAGDTELLRPYYQVLLAEAQGLAGRPEVGLEVLELAIERAERSGCGFWKPELHRHRSRLLLALATPATRRAVKELEVALAEARQRRERMLELRVLNDLALLHRGDDARRRPVLAELETLMRGFSEGQETPELVTARELTSNV
ncbi:MAG: AAA family ATPase [Acidobacteriota bacterium]